jgi:hypothetical protein
MDSFKKFVVPSAELEETLESLSEKYSELGNRQLAGRAAQLSDRLRTLNDELAKFYRETSAMGMVRGS